MQKTILVFGTIAGLVVSATMLVMMLIHRQNPARFDHNELVGYASMLLSASLIPVAVKSYRDRYLAGSISFKTAFLVGLGVAIIAAVFYVVTWVIMYKTVYPNFARDYTKSMINRLKVEGKSPAEIAAARLEMQSMFSYYDTWPGLIGLTFMEIFPVGLFVALCSALILKKKPAATLTSTR